MPWGSGSPDGARSHDLRVGGSESSDSRCSGEQPAEGRKADFFTFRHTGASHLAEKTGNPIFIVKMMGDTNVQTVMRHYFNLDVDFMAEMVKGWAVPNAATDNTYGPTELIH